VVTVEDGLADGGVGAALADELRRRSQPDRGPKVAVLGVPDRYLPHAKPDAILAELGLDAAGIARSVRVLLG
jgi:1-deoxy-D-xylulose-5-phosphate synthase